MQIILMCPGALSGQAAFHAQWIEGAPAPERRYNIIDGKITLSGYADVILHHDADELLASPLYRMPTPGEQEQMAKDEFAASALQETEQGEEQVIPIVTEDMPVSPPAQQKRPYKKRG